MDLQLGDIQKTALIPLVIRANETKRKNARIRDKKALEILNALETTALKIDAKRFDSFFSHEGVVARTILFDTAVSNLLETYPSALCVNLGCGLDDRFSRVDNGKCAWFNIDLPDSIAVRRNFFLETQRERIISGDILTPDWMEGIPANSIVIVIAEGLLMYFSRAQVKAILNNITGAFCGGFLLAELMHPKMMNEKMHDTVRHTNAKFGWGTQSGKELLELDENLELLEEISFWQEAKKHTLAGKIGSVLLKNLNNRLAVYKWVK